MSMGARFVIIFRAAGVTGDRKGYVSLRVYVCAHLCVCVCVYSWESSSIYVSVQLHVCRLFAFVSVCLCD